MAENHAGLLNWGIQPRRNRREFALIFHGRSQRQRKRKDACIGATRLDELRGLGDVLAQHQL
jgi:hypothetical protein